MARAAPTAEAEPGGRSPLDADPRAARADLSRGGYARTVAIELPTLLFSVSPWGQRALGVVPGALAAVMLTHAAVFGFNVWRLGPERFCARALWPYRAVAYGLTVALASQWGAVSRLDASPAWATLLLTPLFLAHAAPGSALLAAELAVVPVALRALSVPGATGGSLVVAAAFGAVASALYTLESARAEALRREAGQGDAEEALGREEDARVAEVRAALSIQDGLSRALAVAREEVLRDADPAPRAAAFAERARTALAGVLGPGAATLDAATLERALRALAGDGARVTVRGSFAALHDDERFDLRDIALECAAACAAPGAVDASLEVSVGARSVVVRAACRGGDGFAGRRLQAIRLRAQRRGGDVDARRDGASHAARVTWDCGTATAARAWLFGWWAWAWFPCATAAVGVAMALVTRRFGPLLMVGAGLAYALMAVRNYVADAQAAQRRLADVRARRRVERARDVLDLVAGEVGGALSSLDAAVGARDAAAVRASFVRCGDVLGDLRWSLEYAGDDQQLADDLRRQASGRGVRFEPASVVGGTAGDPVRRYRARAALRTSRA